MCKAPRHVRAMLRVTAQGRQRGGHQVQALEFALALAGLDVQQQQAPHHVALREYNSLM